jgi:hypothetical protein
MHEQRGIKSCLLSHDLCNEYKYYAMIELMRVPHHAPPYHILRIIKDLMRSHEKDELRYPCKHTEGRIYNKILYLKRCDHCNCSWHQYSPSQKTIEANRLIVESCISTSTAKLWTINYSLRGRFGASSRLVMTSLLLKVGSTVVVYSSEPSYCLHTMKRVKQIEQ